jgi:hypothetical protein
MANITSVTVTFGNGLKREEYGPVKKAEVSITASVAEDEDGAAVLSEIGILALAKVAELLSAPKPDTAEKLAANDSQEGAPSVGEAPARRTRGPNKPKTEAATSAETLPSADTEASPEAAKPTEPAAEDDWAAGADDIEITDQEILSATSKRAGELGAREPIVKLIATFATRTEGAPFKVQEIPANQRKDYLTKLAALTA